MKEECKYCLDCGKEITKNAIRCVSCSVKGRTPWNKNLKLSKVEYPNMGMRNKTHSDITKQRMNMAKKGQPCNFIKHKFKKGHIPKSKGKTFEELYGEDKAKELKNHLSKILISHTPWNKDKKIDRKNHPNMGHFRKHTRESKIKISETKTGKNLGKENSRYIHFEKDKKDMIKLYKQGLDTRQLAILYNTNMTTIRHRLREWGVELRKSLYMGSENLISDDGHNVRSYSELFIDNWLFHNGIIHVYEKRIGFGNFKTDFYIPEANIWIEYWGLQDVKTYREKTERKLEIYKSLGLNLLSVFPSDNIQKKLNFLLKYSQIQKQLEVFI